MRIPDARFTCQSCGRCCTMWTITVDQAKVQQLRQHDWGGEPFQARRGEGDAFQLRMVNGRCFFLDENNYCRIHRELGYKAKPEGCKAFPLHVSEIAGEQYLRLSFYCPAVAQGKGKPLIEQNRWIKETIKGAGDVSRKEPLALDGQVELTVRDVNALEDLLVALLSDQDHPVSERLAAGAAVIQRSRRAVAEKGKGALKSTLKAAGDTPLLELAQEGRRGGAASKAGPILSLFLGPDCAPGAWARFGHFFGLRFFNIGLGSLRSHMMQAKASRGAIARVRFDPPAGAQALLTRYFLHKLQARRPLSGDLSFFSGYNLQVVAYGIVNLLARVRAAAAGRSTCDEEDVARAVQAADLLVMEHTTLYQGSMLATLTDSVLAQESLCASLLARVAPSQGGH